jgi:hypothetical protein
VYDDVAGAQGLWLPWGQVDIGVILVHQIKSLCFIKCPLVNLGHFIARKSSLPAKFPPHHQMESKDSQKMTTTLSFTEIVGLTNSESIL